MPYLFGEDSTEDYITTKVEINMPNIAWRSWGDPAFAESRDSGKPILLSISAVWCHWCHIMDQRAYSDPKIIDTINQNFIPIRADVDREPDINVRYNMGGWPSTVFLTPDRDVLTGATYLPPDRMRIVLDRVMQAYDEQHDELDNKAKEARQQTEDNFRRKGGSASSCDIDKLIDSLRTSYDIDNGGFGTTQKFPHTSALQLLMAFYESCGSEGDMGMVSDSLDAMIDGEIFDRIEGGMFRYATHKDWSKPHYEKLLTDNAKMASVLLDAYRITAKEQYLQASQRIFSYMENTLLDSKSGLFHGSQDADEEYYQADLEARKSMRPPKVDSLLYVDSNAILARSYFKLYGIGRDLKARDKALRIISALNSLAKAPDGTVAHYVENGQPHGYGMLADMAELVSANASATEATGDDTYILKAKELLECVFSEFGAENGGFYDVSASRADDRSLSRYTTPIEENATLAIAFVKTADMIEDEAYRLSARQVLDALSPFVEDYEIMASSYGFALVMLDQSPVLVTVHAYPGTEEADAFIQASLGACSISCTVRTVPLEEGEPAVTACLGASCRVRVTEPADVALALEDLAAEYVQQAQQSEYGGNVT